MSSEAGADGAGADQVAPYAAAPYEVAPDGFFQDPHPVYRAWRERAGGVHRVLIPGEIPLEGWAVTGHAACRAALADPRLAKNAATEAFAARPGGGGPGPGPGRALTAHMLNSDPPRHTRLRALVQRAFTARRVAALRPVIEGHVERLLDGLEGLEGLEGLDGLGASGAVDLVAGFAIPLPLAVIFDLLGADASDGAGDVLAAWAAQLSGEEGDGEVSPETAMAMAGHISALLAHKRAHPGDDLLTELVAARDDGDRLSEQEITSMAFLLVVAGHQTTANLIANAVHALLTHPDRLAALRADPSLTGPLIEEVLRYESPFAVATIRYATEPVPLGGVTIPAGDFVQIGLLSANRDPAVFADPDRFDPDRFHPARPDAGAHLAFGHGVHHCLGAPLARLQARIAVDALLRRHPRMTLTAAPHWRHNPRHRGPRALRVLLG
ncbi:cytochrome P450 [Streptomyces sp. RerS4]|uniref:cytochrome P450 family protein n=1 Tax=Streptomyces sp. RerS4 TaxID=2942449 RepID=UPI00201BE253|nr:cytochrome P450 [Streptomyces sp. RerS4]UQX02355.1 cytochrome P450 [Streptomyces sp. RerS4]